MPARARFSGFMLRMLRPSNVISPAIVFCKPVMLLSVVVLPTPLRPIKQTSRFAGTSSCTPRRMREPPMLTWRLSMRSMSVVVMLAAEINLYHAFVVLHFVDAAFAQNRALVQHGHFFRNLPDENHVVLDDDNRVPSREAQQQLAGFCCFFISHAGGRFIDEQ